MLPFGGGGGRIGRARMRLDEMDCADIMRKAVQRKRSRSIARRESFSGTEDDLRKFREAVESNDKDSDLQKDIEEYAVKVRELRGGEGVETAKAQDTSNDAETKLLESKPLIQKVENENQPSDSNISDVNIKSEPSTSHNTEENVNKEPSESLHTEEIILKEPSDSLNTDEEVKSYEHTSTGLNSEENIHTEEETSTGLDIEENKASHEESSTSRNTEEEIQPCADVTAENFEEKEEVIEDFKAPETCNSAEEETFNDRSPKYDDENIVVAEEANKKEELTPEKVNCIEEYSNEGQNLVDVSEEHDTVKETVLEISTPNEESAIVVDIYQDIEADDVTKECVEKGEDELNEIQETDADPNETRDHTDKIEDMTENMEQIPSGLVESGGDTEEITPRKEDTDCKEILDQQDTGTSEFVTTESSDNCEAEPDQIEPELEFIASDNKEEIDEEASVGTGYTEDVTEPAVVDTLEGESNEDVTAVDATTRDCPDKPSGEPDGFLSIVDRIKNDITTLKTISKEGAVTADKAGHTGEVPSSEESPLDGEPKQSGLKVALDRVSREKSASHVQIPQELSSHLISLSSANISEQLRKSCSNIVARSQDQELSKEFLLKKLEELLKQERKQVTEDLKRRKEQLLDTRETNAIELESLKKKHKEELKKLRNDHSVRFSSFENDFLDEMERLKKEIELLENEKDNMVGPNKLISDCLSSRSSSSAGSRQLTDLEAELECCSCSYICRAPCKIYQCPEGDLLCEYCVEEKTRSYCPKCGISLAGALSRNKGLEKIAAKYS